jgi:hypothetical protein
MHRHRCERSNRVSLTRFTDVVSGLAEAGRHHRKKNKTHSNTSLRWTVFEPPMPQGMVIEIQESTKLLTRWCCDGIEGENIRTRLGFGRWTETDQG